MSNELERLSRLIADFGEAMRCKLWKKHRIGYRGWDDSTNTNLVSDLGVALTEHVNRYRTVRDPSQLVDIANLAAILWRIEVQIPHNKIANLAEELL